MRFTWSLRKYFSNLSLYQCQQFYFFENRKGFDELKQDKQTNKIESRSTQCGGRYSTSDRFERVSNGADTCLSFRGECQVQKPRIHDELRFISFTECLYSGV